MMFMILYLRQAVHIQKYHLYQAQVGPTTTSRPLSLQTYQFQYTAYLIL